MELTPACERCPVMISVPYDLEVPVVMHLLLHATHLAPVSCCCLLCCNHAPGINATLSWLTLIVREVDADVVGGVGAARLFET